MDGIGCKVCYHDLCGFLGIDPAVPPGYQNLSYIVRIKW
jgi:hypothetical protein